MERSKEFDVVERPKHYNSHPSGLEAIDICEHLSFNVGNAVKYIWRAGLKNDEVEDLKKALWYIKREREFSHLRRDIGFNDDAAKLVARTLMRKVRLSDPDGLLARVFTWESLEKWEDIVSEEIRKRAA